MSDIIKEIQEEVKWRLKAMNRGEYTPQQTLRNINKKFEELKQSLAKKIKKVRSVDGKVNNPEFELGYRLACDLITGELGLEDSKNGRRIKE